MFRLRKPVSTLILSSSIATLGVVSSSSSSSTTGCDDNTKNSAFVFVKPHANTKKVQDIVKKTFDAKGHHHLPLSLPL